MNNKNAGLVHWSFWVIGAVTLVWNLMGAINFLAQMNTDMVASMPETHRAIIETRPAWATAAFAIAVFSGVLGCLLLLLRKSTAVYLFIASLLGVIAVMTHTIGIVNSIIGLTAFEIVLMVVMPLVVPAFLIWYSKQAENMGWIG